MAIGGLALSPLGLVLCYVFDSLEVSIRLAFKISQAAKLILTNSDQSMRLR